MTEIDVRRRSELPQENVDGEPIEYVWVVHRPAANSHVGRCELLGAHDNAESARKHAMVASREGKCEVQEMAIQDGQNPFSD